MNREIKFRAYDKKRKEMRPVLALNGLKEKDDYEFKYVASNQNLDGEGTIAWKDCVLMQYTGLLDKNGKEIYEFDIILYDNDKKAKVVWKKGGFVFVYEDNVENILSESWYAPADVKITEVIGNIYENKDLLNN